MKKRLLVVAAGFLAAASIGRCGGKIFDGYFDEDGFFHGADGGVAWGPGTSCDGYDASQLRLSSQGFVQTTIACDEDAAFEAGVAFCESQLPSGLFAPIDAINVSPESPNYHQQFFRTSCNGGTCRLDPDLAVACPSLGDLGDYYCRQFYQQFVAAPDASARASCRQCPGGNIACAGNFICIPDCCNGNDGFCVQRGGAAPACEYPCEP